MRRLRDGELIAGAGGLALLASLFLGWYSGASAWEALSVVDVLLALLALVPLALVVVQATRASPSLPVAFSVFTVVAGMLATLLVLFRIVDKPAGGEVELGAWVGLGAAVVTAAGGWRSMRVEEIPGAARPPVEDLPAPTP